MGLLDTLTGQVLGSLSGEGAQRPAGLADAILALVNDPQSGGLRGLIGAFEQQGLGDIVSSWIGTGQNQPVSAEQVQSALGSEQVDAIAQKLGVTSQEASGHLAELLPQIVDKLTPNGTVPEGGDLAGMLGSLKDLLR
ncbi:YidB family protein [Oryzomicrobium sp.]|uniref:YidB family protein n=1 Tax=Oryzomicrobium sp. TaxID=1911578 RepID=UPI0025CFB807|nr:YidB family protein [Oryzomicrobium sp.]MCE1241642.1 YidB family protein [Oryzomicrobium sp.]